MAFSLSWYCSVCDVAVYYLSRRLHWLSLNIGYALLRDAPASASLAPFFGHWILSRFGKRNAASQSPFPLGYVILLHGCTYQGCKASNLSSIIQNLHSITIKTKWIERSWRCESNYQLLGANFHNLHHWGYYLSVCNYLLVNLFQKVPRRNIKFWPCFAS